MPTINPITTWEEITIKAQEFTDRLDSQLAWIGAAQTSADDAQADATQALGTIYQTGLDATLYTDQQIQALRSELTGSWTTAEGTITGDVTDYVNQYYANLLADIDAKNAAHSASLQGVEDNILNLFGTVDGSLSTLSNTELPSVNAWIQTLIGDLDAVEDGITILTANMTTSSIYDEINAYTIAVKSSIEDPLGNSIGATLSQSYLTAVGTQNAISVANLALKSEIEDPNGASIGAALENSYYTSAQADVAMAGQISTFNASVPGGVTAQVSSHTDAIADLEGNASATYVMRVKAGTGGAALEMVAADDPINGSASSLRLSADDIILDGSVTADHINATGLTISAGNISGTILQSQVSNLSGDLTSINNVANSAQADANTAQDTADDAVAAAALKNRTISLSYSPSYSSYDAGDLLYRTDLDKFYRNSGAGWVPISIEADSIVASYVYAGDINANQVTAGLFNADKLNLNGLMLENSGGSLSIKSSGITTSLIQVDSTATMDVSAHSAEENPGDMDTDIGNVTHTGIIGVDTIAVLYYTPTYESSSASGEGTLTAAIKLAGVQRVAADHSWTGQVSSANRGKDPCSIAFHINWNTGGTKTWSVDFGRTEFSSTVKVKNVILMVHQVIR